MERVLETNNLCLGYNKDIYREISAFASRGEIIAVVGPNGIGKSTLLKSLSGIQSFRSGEILVDGKQISSYSHSRLAEKISFVPSQSPRARNLSLFDMVATGCYNRTNWLGQVGPQEREFVIGTLERVGLSGFENRDSSKLSDGEFQRATIARALVQESKIIFLDEPTAFLDIENKLTITKLLSDIAHEESRSVIFSTHDLQLAIRHCDRIWIMGRESFSHGTPEELIEKGAFDTMFKDSPLKFDRNLYTFV